MIRTGCRISAAGPLIFAFPGSVAALPCGSAASGVGRLGVPGVRVTGRAASYDWSRAIRAVFSGTETTGSLVRTEKSSGETAQL